MSKQTISAQAIKKYDLEQPTQIVAMAKVLKDYIVKNNLYVSIANKNYVLVEGWQFAGGLLGLFPRIVEVKDLGNNKWLAKVEIINKKDGSVVSSGFALCSKAESKKKTFDEYAILSMAQTRAIGKAYRNLIGWVMKLAGYEPTPAEEIKNGNAKPVPIPKKQNKVSTLPASDDDKLKIFKLLKEIGKTDDMTENKASQLIFKTLAVKVEFESMTKTQAGNIIAQLLAKQLNKKKP